MNVDQFLFARIAEEEAAAKAVLTANEAFPGWGSERGANRVLAECATKRAIIRATDTLGMFDEWDSTRLSLLSHLASVYSGHPDYVKAWEGWQA